MIQHHNIEAEKAVLAGMLIDAEAINKVVGILEPDDFWDLFHRDIYAAALLIRARGRVFDLISVTEDLRDARRLPPNNGVTVLASLVDYLSTAENVTYYAKIVKECSLERRLKKAALAILTRKEDSA